MNYLTRKSGTYTTQYISITATKTVNLQGLDGSYTDNVSTAFTVADESGYNWYLVDSTTVYAGITSLEFRAQDIGNIIPTIGTITQMVTIVDGITNVINNVGYTTLGTTQESDEEFRLRRERSVSLASGNSADRIISAVLDLDGVNYASLHVNYTNETDSTGTESKTVWLVVDGGANSDIADILYENIGGCLTRGSVAQVFNNIAGQEVTMYFDRPNITPYFIKYDLYTTGDKSLINQTSIIESLTENLPSNLGEGVEVQQIYNTMEIAIGLLSGTVFAQNVKLSRGGSATATVSGSITGANIIASTFQSKVFTGSETDTSGSYVFTFDGDNWLLNEDTINLSEYGITVEGTPAENDTITVDYTAGVWVDSLTVDSIQTKFTTDVNRIYSNILE